MKQKPASGCFCSGIFFPKEQIHKTLCPMLSEWFPRSIAHRNCWTFNEGEGRTRRTLRKFTESEGGIPGICLAFELNIIKYPAWMKWFLEDSDAESRCKLQRICLSYAALILMVAMFVDFPDCFVDICVFSRRANQMDHHETLPYIIEMHFHNWWFANVWDCCPSISKYPSFSRQQFSQQHSLNQSKSKTPRCLVDRWPAALSTVTIDTCWELLLKKHSHSCRNSSFQRSATSSNILQSIFTFHS